MDRLSLLIAAVPVAALAIDITMGELPPKIHPVVGIGTSLTWVWNRRTPGMSRGRDFIAGLTVVLGGLLICGGLAFLAQWGAVAIYRYLGSPAALVPLLVLLLALLLKSSLAYRALLEAGKGIETALAESRLEDARRILGWNLVSRNVDDLDEGSVASACIESLAENYVDSVVAPLFFWSIFGLPGAWAYRFSDTADSMFGYRDEKREWFGKAAARLDDLLCFVPARLGGWLIVGASVCVSRDARTSMATMMRDAARCPSPNSGWPMAAAAGALGVRLNKVGVYTLNDGGRIPGADDIRRIRTVLNWATVFTVVIAGLVTYAVRLPAIR